MDWAETTARRDEKDWSVAIWCVLYQRFDGKYHWQSMMRRSCGLQWRHIELHSAPNHQPHDCLFNRLFRRRSKKTSKPRGTGLCARNSSVTAQTVSNVENVFIWWRHHGFNMLYFLHKLFYLINVNDSEIFQVCFTDTKAIELEVTLKSKENMRNFVYMNIILNTFNLSLTNSLECIIRIHHCRDDTELRNIVKKRIYFTFLQTRHSLYKHRCVSHLSLLSKFKLNSSSV